MRSIRKLAQDTLNAIEGRSLLYISGEFSMVLSDLWIHAARIFPFNDSAKKAWVNGHVITKAFTRRIAEIAFPEETQGIKDNFDLLREMAEDFEST